MNERVDWLAGEPVTTRQRIANALSPTERAEFAYHWEFFARPQQVPPPGDWRIWLVLAGRGFGLWRLGRKGRCTCSSDRRILALHYARRRHVRVRPVQRSKPDFPESVGSSQRTCRTFRGVSGGHRSTGSDQCAPERIVARGNHRMGPSKLAKGAWQIGQKSVQTTNLAAKTPSIEAFLQQ